MRGGSGGRARDAGAEGTFKGASLSPHFAPLPLLSSPVPSLPPPLLSLPHPVRIALGFSARFASGPRLPVSERAQAEEGEEGGFRREAREDERRRIQERRLKQLPLLRFLTRSLRCSAAPWTLLPLLLPLPPPLRRPLRLLPLLLLLLLLLLMLSLKLQLPGDACARRDRLLRMLELTRRPDDVHARACRPDAPAW